MQEQRKKLFSYAIIMLVAAVLIVLIAYMSENRADMYESEITKNQTEIELIQSQLAQLTNENYELKKQNEKNMTAASDFEDYRIKLDIIKAAWEMHNAGDNEGALLKLSELDRAALDDTSGAFYDSVMAQLQPAV